MEPPPKVIDVEVVRESPGERPTRPAASGPPIHPLAALLLVVIDNLWNVPEFLLVDLPITIPLSFLSVFVPTFFIQKFLKQNSATRAMSYALLLGALAAVPFSVTGTPVGLALLAWTGINRLLGRSLPPSPTPPNARS